MFYNWQSHLVKFLSLSNLLLVYVLSAILGYFRRIMNKNSTKDALKML